jgi:hypothetical protein
MVNTKRDGNSKKPMEMLETKTTVTQMMNALDRLSRRLDTVKERIIDLEDMSVENS